MEKKQDKGVNEEKAMTADSKEQEHRGSCEARKERRNGLDG